MRGPSTVFPPAPPATLSARILVVDDEPDISALIAYHLERESYRVHTAGSGPDAVRAAEVVRPDLIVLDTMLPGMSGLEVFEELRRRPETLDIPVILLTARRDEERIRALRQAADDHVAKPFSPQELILRVGAVLRRVQQAPPAATNGALHAGPISVDVTAGRAEVDGQPLDLTPTEHRLLATLIQSRGRVLSRRQLLEDVWEVRANIATRTVDMHVQRLRNKLGGQADWIETVRGFGYRFRTEPPSS